MNSDPEAVWKLLNSRMAYVSVSGAQFDVQMYTNDAGALGQATEPRRVQSFGHPADKRADRNATADAKPAGRRAEDRAAAAWHGALSGSQPEPVIKVFIVTASAAFNASIEAVFAPVMAIDFALAHTVSLSAAARNSLPS